MWLQEAIPKSRVFNRDSIACSNNHFEEQPSFRFGNCDFVRYACPIVEDCILNLDQLLLFYVHGYFFPYKRTALLN